MKYLGLIDYYSIVHKEYANIYDVMALIECDEDYAYILLNQFIEKEKEDFKYYVTKRNIFIPMYIFIKHFKLNEETINRYHGSLCGFF